ncbi:hypothetical protein T4B_10768 [Trichinella pseudospiralis]|uniref:Uncharacterized protein n=1 Tax=Trichinella pseudospiralis TaxID=6337 RepID=A0A0V1HK16_TRIPS|nr:hypothetical protein T4B_10768 [Trichinella pseudospiralis]KRZ26380.1 hypothetical protein T4C_2699 [Trichinella pseudospiralis]
MLYIFPFPFISQRNSYFPAIRWDSGILLNENACKVEAEHLAQVMLSLLPALPNSILEWHGIELN